MLTGSDKELKQLKASRLFQVSEFHKMVLALQRFKEENAVKALTGRKNIRHQKSPDKVFFSVLEKMLLEVSCFTENLPFHKAEQQLLSLKKVFSWFQSNKHVLLKSDGYFKAARKITEDFYEKQLKVQAKSRIVDSSKSSNTKPSGLKTIDAHLEKLRLAEHDATERHMQSDSSMFARSPTQGLTSTVSATITDQANYMEDLDFAREVYEHEYLGGNRIEHLNRPMTAPLKLRRGPNPPTRTHTPTRTHVSIQHMQFEKPASTRPRSALTQVQHDLSWAKESPLPLTVLIQKNAEKISKQETNETKKQIRVDLPSDSESLIKTLKLAGFSGKVDDEKKIENLVLFKQFCLERELSTVLLSPHHLLLPHAAEQENHSRQFTHDKHGTRQHFLEFPENRTESVVRQTATALYRGNQDAQRSRNFNENLSAYHGMSLEQFLDHDVALKSRDVSSQTVHDNVQSENSFSLQNQYVPIHSTRKVPHPPSTNPERIIQPSNDPLKVSVLSKLASETGKRMNVASEQALSAPKHGWRYPVVPIPLFSQAESVKTSASGVVLALQENDAVQHKVLIPLASNIEGYQNQGVQTNYMNENDVVADDFRPKSSFTTVAEHPARAVSSRLSTRPWSSPRYITEVRAILRNKATGSRSCFDIRPDFEHGKHEVCRRSLRSAGVSGGPSRPRTAASWGSYPSKAEVSRSTGAASHHSTGILRHRSVAETMRVKSVIKKSLTSNSGRSSASSYAAQLRERKRAGAKYCAQIKPGPRKSFDHDQMGCNIIDRKPNLSFIQIASPMSMPTGAAMRTYVKPGGVYCGSTAAVVVAGEGQVNVMDDQFSDGQLSYEDYFVNTPVNESATNGESTPGDHWLSQWLTGGPLDGLQDVSGNGKATTYADLVSRAAIVNSSDEQLHSDEPPFSFNAVPNLNGISAEKVLSLSPIEDISLSPRTDPLFSHRTDNGDEVTRDNDADGVTHDNDDGCHSENDTYQFETEEEIDLIDSETSQIPSDSLLSSDQSFKFEEETDETTEDKSCSEKIKLKGEAVADDTAIALSDVEGGSTNSNEAEAPASFKRLHSIAGRLNEVEVYAESMEASPSSSLNKNMTILQSQTRTDIDAQPDANKKATLTTSRHKILLEVDSTDDRNEVNKPEAEDDLHTASTRIDSSSTYDTMTESETEFAGDDVPVRIVVTSSRKVERELAEGNSSGFAVNLKPNFLRTCSIPDDGYPRLITREEVSAVASMARPHSSRPIPSETKVRDPFVDFMASTRQKQIDRSVDVQSIFKAPPPDKKENVNDEAKREEQEAAIKMQRAYRRHLARVRAARKCQGLSQETLDWARSYKAMLTEKREMRNRRLRDSRRSFRTLQRREAKKINRIGPHHDVFEIYHPDPVFPHPEVIQESAVVIQKLVRGWLVRRRLKRVKDAAERRGSSLSAVVSEYRSLLQRTQRRHGKLRPSLYLTYDELEDYLQQRAKFEFVFKKRQFWNEMEAAELTAFFNDCGLFPSQHEINEAWESISKSIDFVPKKKKHSPTAMSKEDVIEVAFHIYVPAGARMKPESTRSSTWMTPIYEGKEGLKLLAAFKENKEVEIADLEKVTKFVAQTFKERKKMDEA